MYPILITISKSHLATLTINRYKVSSLGGFPLVYENLETNCEAGPRGHYNVAISLCAVDSIVDAIAQPDREFLLIHSWVNYTKSINFIACGCLSVILGNKKLFTAGIYA